MIRLLPLALLSSLCCTPEPIKSPTTLPQGQARSALQPRLPRGPDIGDQIMAFLVIRDGARVATELASGGDPTEELARTFGVDPQLTRVLDLRRPLAVAMLNPGLLSTPTVRPYVAMLPIRSPEATLKLLAARGSVTPTPWGAVWTTPAGEIQVAFHGGYAVIAWRKDLLGPTVRLLGPRLAERSEAPVRVHLNLVNLYAAYRPQIAALVTRFALAAARGGAANDPQLGYGLRAVKSMLPYLESFSGLDLVCGSRLGRAHALGRRGRQARRRLGAVCRAAAPGSGVGRALPAARRSVGLHHHRQPDEPGGRSRSAARVHAEPVARRSRSLEERARSRGRRDRG